MIEFQLVHDMPEKLSNIRSYKINTVQEVKYACGVSDYLLHRL